MTEDDYQFSHHDGRTAGEMLDDLSIVYADAYGVEPGEKVDAFGGRAKRAFVAPRFDLVTARDGGELVAFVFGYSLESDAWWSGLDPEPPPGFTEETGSRTVVLSEIEVLKTRQRQGLGRRLHEVFLAARCEERATLATGADAPSRHVYPHWGWTEVGTVPGSAGSYFPSYRRFVRVLGANASE